MILGQSEIKELTENGILPVSNDLEKAGDNLSEELMEHALHPFLMGKVSAVVHERKSAKEIVDEIVNVAVERMGLGGTMLIQKSRL
jgi:hypothetical protein